MLSMPQLIGAATRIPVPGGKLIDEYVGRVNNGEARLSVAHMRSPSGWTEPGQTPDFDEYTLVLRGTMRVESREGTLEVNAGQAILCRAGEWIRYSTPGPEGCEYVAICLPAFSLDGARRDPEELD
jgi:mannose-6-phosphate isomerase-like protein (cupin superfamily)